MSPVHRRRPSGRGRRRRRSLWRGAGRSSGLMAEMWGRSPYRGRAFAEKDQGGREVGLLPALMASVRHLEGIMCFRTEQAEPAQSPSALFFPLLPPASPLPLPRPPDLPPLARLLQRAGPAPAAAHHGVPHLGLHRHQQHFRSPLHRLWRVFPVSLPPSQQPAAVSHMRPQRVRRFMHASLQLLQTVPV